MSRRLDFVLENIQKDIPLEDLETVVITKDNFIPFSKLGTVYALDGQFVNATSVASAFANYTLPLDSIETMYLSIMLIEMLKYNEISTQVIVSVIAASNQLFIPLGLTTDYIKHPKFTTIPEEAYATLSPIESCLLRAYYCQYDNSISVLRDHFIQLVPFVGNHGCSALTDDAYAVQKWAELYSRLVGTNPCSRVKPVEPLYFTFGLLNHDFIQQGFYRLDKSASPIPFDPWASMKHNYINYYNSDWIDRKGDLLFNKPIGYGNKIAIPMGKQLLFVDLTGPVLLVPNAHNNKYIAQMIAPTEREEIAEPTNIPQECIEFAPDWYLHWTSGDLYFVFHVDPHIVAFNHKATNKPTCVWYGSTISNHTVGNRYTHLTTKLQNIGDLTMVVPEGDLIVEETEARLKLGDGGFLGMYVEGNIVPKLDYPNISGNTIEVRGTMFSINYTDGVLTITNANSGQEQIFSLSSFWAKSQRAAYSPKSKLYVIA